MIDVDYAKAYGHLGGKDLIQVMTQQVFKGRVAVTSSFGAESAVLLDLVAQVDPSVPVIFLDTGELFDETLEYRYRLERQLGLTDVRVVRPSSEDLSEAEDLWRTDHDRCCYLRKVLPLARATEGFAALIDGRKQAHGFERQTCRRSRWWGASPRSAPWPIGARTTCKRLSASVACRPTRWWNRAIAPSVAGPVRGPPSRANRPVPAVGPAAPRPNAESIPLYSAATAPGFDGND